MTGTVKFFNESKGYGFITNDESGEDVFVHVTALNGLSLQEGDKVEYTEEDGNKGNKPLISLSYNSLYTANQNLPSGGFFIFFYFEKTLSIELKIQSHIYRLQHWF